jgi:repressor LexA
MSALGNKEIMARNIKRYMQKIGISRKDFCERLGFAYSTVTDWLNAEKYPRIDKIEMMANFFGISKADLVEPPAPPAASEKPHKKGVLIPVLGVVRAGVPIHAEEDIIDYEEIPQEMARSGEYFGLRVTGSSMEPTLRDGDVIIVRKQPDVDNGDIAIVLVDGEDATVKEIRETPEGVTLIGHNVAVYQPHFYSNREIESLPVQIVGRVVELRRKF